MPSSAGSWVGCSAGSVSRLAHSPLPQVRPLPAVQEVRVGEQRERADPQQHRGVAAEGHRHVGGVGHHPPLPVRGGW
jgi:hypothetical protein